MKRSNGVEPSFGHQSKMKHLLFTTIAAVLLVGCGKPSLDIWQASSSGYLESVRLNLTLGTNINARDANQMTPIFHAVSNEKMAVTEFLIKEGAEINTYDNKWKTPPDYAVELKHAELTNLLRKHGAKTSEEMMAYRKKKGVI